MRNEELKGKRGVVTAEDVSNALTRENVRGRDGMVEEQIVTKVLWEIEVSNSGIHFQSFTDSRGKLEVL